MYDISITEDKDPTWQRQDCIKNGKQMRQKKLSQYDPVTKPPTLLKHMQLNPICWEG
jgi:hypothetical protein